MRVLLAVLLAAVAALAACGKPDCPAKSGYNECGYCSLDRVTSSNPHAGMCTYCTGACVDACNPCGTDGGGGGGCDTSWVSRCGTTSGGIQFTGQPVKKPCGCPNGTRDAGDDNVTAGGPYDICVCNGY